MAGAESEIGPPAVFFEAHREALLETRALGPTLDLASGRGRHALAAAEMGLDVLAVDRNEDHLTTLRATASGRGLTLDTATLDLEGDAPPELGAGRFGAVLVFRYLHRPLAGWIESLLAPGGVLLYETFTTRQRDRGWGPSRDAFLLAPGELPTLFPALERLAYEEGPSGDAKTADTARLAARKPGATLA